MVGHVEVEKRIWDRYYIRGMATTVINQKEDFLFYFLMREPCFSYRQPYIILHIIINGTNVKLVST